MRYRAIRAGWLGRRIRTGEVFDSDVDCTSFAVAVAAPTPATPSLPPDPAPADTCSDACLCLPPLVDVVDDRSLAGLSDAGINTSEELREAIVNGLGDDLVDNVPFFTSRWLAKASATLKIGVQQ